MTAITDLTNTTWVVPAGWSATAGYGRYGDIAYTATSDYFTEHSSSYFYVGYDGDFRDNFSTPTINVIVVGSYGQFDNEDGFTITFTGGTDATNPSLISWLEANGECQNPPAPEGVTIKYKDTTIPVEAGQTVTLNTADKKLTGDIEVTAPKESGGGGKKYSITYTGIADIGESTYEFFPTEIYENQTICIVTNAKWYGGDSVKGAERKGKHLPMYGGGNLVIIEISNPTSDVVVSFRSN